MQELLYGLKQFLCFEFAACFLPPSKRAKKRGKFKPKNFFQSIELFLCCLSSTSHPFLSIPLLLNFTFNKIMFIQNCVHSLWSNRYPVLGMGMSAIANVVDWGQLIVIFLLPWESLSIPTWIKERRADLVYLYEVLCYCIRSRPIR